MPHKHGHATNGVSKEYSAWANAKNRCHRVSDPKYPQYGGRGIIMCDRWRESFSNFISDMGECPVGLTLDRKDSNGNYCPENCRWVTMTEQQNNRTNNRWIQLGTERHTLAQWGEISGLGTKLLWSFLKRGTAEEVLGYLTW